MRIWKYMSNLNIQTLINEIITANSAYNTSKRDNRKFSISDAGGCYRARIYKRLGIPPTREIEISALRKMMAGNSGHEKLQQLLWKGNKMFMSENSVESEHLLGHPDGIIKTGDTKVLVEFKTIEKFQMGYIRKQGAKQPHILQMFTYWSLLRKDIQDLDNAVLSYIKREDFEALDFHFIWNDSIKAQVDQEWEPLIKYWINKTLPDCTCIEMYNGAGPKYCNYLNNIENLTCCDEKLFKGDLLGQAIGYKPELLDNLKITA